MIIQELKYRYTWGSTFDEDADVTVYWKYDSGRAYFTVTTHEGTEHESDLFDADQYEIIMKELTIFMTAFVVDFDLGAYT